MMIVDDEWILWPNLLTPGQCELFIKDALAVQDIAGDMTWKEGDVPFPEVRSSRIRWLMRHNETFNWIFTIGDFIVGEGDRRFGFQTKPMESYQFTEYHAGRLGHYDWHHDDFDQPYDRLMSLVIQLSDVADYEGGRLELRVKNPPPAALLQQRGAAIVFPSTTYHRVTQTTGGLRYSAVTWRYGQRPI